MTYALRKLIAFVFLGGMFWFIYQDLDNLDKPWFMHALGMLAVVFAFFWLLIPMVVVRLRIRHRVGRNQERYDRWLAEGGTKNAKLDGSAVYPAKRYCRVFHGGIIDLPPAGPVIPPSRRTGAEHKDY